MGAKRKTIDEIKKYFSNFGYTVLNNVNIKSIEKLNVICPKGHKAQISYNNFSRGKRCGECFGNKKKTIEEVKKHVSDKGFTLLSNTYENAHAMLEFSCAEGHVFKQSWHGFKGCKICSVEGTKLSQEYVRAKFADIGYKLLSKYKNFYSEVEIQCDKGHTYKVNYVTFHKGSRCLKCNGYFEYKDIKKLIEEKGWKLLSKEYINCDSKLDMICSNGHRISTTWYHISKGGGCAECVGNVKKTIDFVKSKIESYGYKLLSTEYVQAHEKLKIECDKGHIINVSWHTFSQGHRCNNCASFKNEKLTHEILQKYFKNIHPHKTIILSDRKVYVDFYIEYNDKKIIVEYNGAQHYRPVRFGSMTKIQAEEKFKNQIIRDDDVRNYCKNNGIILFEIDGRKITGIKRINDEIKNLHTNLSNEF